MAKKDSLFFDNRKLELMKSKAGSNMDRIVSKIELIESVVNENFVEVLDEDFVED